MYDKGIKHLASLSVFHEGTIREFGRNKDTRGFLTHDSFVPYSESCMGVALTLRQYTLRPPGGFPV